MISEDLTFKSFKHFENILLKGAHSASYYDLLSELRKYCDRLSLVFARTTWTVTKTTFMGPEDASILHIITSRKKTVHSWDGRENNKSSTGIGTLDALYSVGRLLLFQ